jgi:hypothetical protein
LRSFFVGHIFFIGVNVEVIMNKNYLLYFSMLLCSQQSVAAGISNTLEPSYPSIPASYTELQPGEMISDARVDFGFENTEVGKTDGFRVTDPNGNTFVVDNIEEPQCAVYVTYIENEDGFNPAIGKIELINNVYIEEINFENCQ